MSDKSLWGDLSDLETVRTPKEILQEQAYFLTEATNGVLVGNVDDKETASDFRYEFDVVVPTLNNYTHTILSVRHDVNLYPVRVISRTMNTSCDDEGDFVTILAKILQSSDVKNVLTNLISQAD